MKPYQRFKANTHRKCKVDDRVICSNRLWKREHNRNTMSEKVSSSSSVAAVPDEAHQVLLVDGTDVQTKVGHVAKFQSVPEKGDDIDLDDLKGYKLAKPSDEFVGLTTEVRREEKRRDEMDFIGIHLGFESLHQ